MRLIESHDSRKFTFGSQGGSMEWKGMAWGSDDPDAVYEYVRLNTPLILSGFVRKSIDCQPVGGGIWEVSVQYGTGEFPSNEDRGGTPPGREVSGPASGDEPLEGSFQFSIEAPRVKITQSYETISKTAKPGFGAAVDYKGAIAPDRDGRVQGAEVPPSVASSWSRTIPGLTVTMRYYRLLVSLAGTTNLFPWYGFERGELLYMGCEGQFKQGEGWTLTHKFGAEPNRKGIDIGNGIVIPAKRGFHYLWVDYYETTEGNRVVTQPLAAYVERVFFEEDFTQIGIGG